MDALIIDTETTGIEDPEVVSVAWLRVGAPRSLDVTDTFDRRYRPSKPITLGAMATHHIRDEDLTECSLSSSFRLPPGTSFIIGHNVDFDWRAIGQPDVKRIDTLCLCRSLWPKADAHTQGAMMYLLERAEAKERLIGAHSASVDVDVCRTILGHIVDQLDVDTWEALWRASEDARVPTTMPFGKHKGMPIANVPRDYKAWLIRQPGVDPYLVQALQR